ncbi:DUF4230 domain-containing protein [uncultured Adlercreutzia sp.]|uniref:DUF4230 domain-containing protein n=1 Tax=uncultured Adlercreutzia sp. TaxID=875803 RepID=UPI0025F67D2E|nr:DUF4230 domain-containing protein [uncultured Adlercreutzia sp.]
MRRSKIIAMVASCALAGGILVSCSANDEPTFSDYERIAELATLECTYHNVAEIYNDGTDLIFGINVGYKKAWFEYDGTVSLGVDASKVSIAGPNSQGVVTITVPDAQVLGYPSADEASFSDVYSDTGLFTSIETVDQSEAFKAAQAEMKESAEGNTVLMEQAKERAETLLEQYVLNVGRAIGQEYTVEFADA